MALGCGSQPRQQTQQERRAVQQGGRCAGLLLVGTRVGSGEDRVSRALPAKEPAWECQGGSVPEAPGRVSLDKEQRGPAWPWRGVAGRDPSGELWQAYQETEFELY